jgi:hypothetical protein
MCIYHLTCCWLSVVLPQVAGSAAGISAFQMDIKVEGITLDIMKKVQHTQVTLLPAASYSSDSDGGTLCCHSQGAVSGDCVQMQRPTPGSSLVASLIAVYVHAALSTYPLTVGHPCLCCPCLCAHPSAGSCAGNNRPRTYPGSDGALQPPSCTWPQQVGSTCGADDSAG